MSNSVRPLGLHTPWNSPGQNTGVGSLSLLQDFRFSRTPGFPLDCKEIKPVNPKGNLSWIFIGRTDAETPILWPPDGEELTHWKRSWCWERLKADGEGDDRGWDGWMASSLYGHEFEQAPRVGDGQGSLVCCSPWGHKEWDMTEWLNWAFKRDSKPSLGEHRGKKGNLVASSISFFFGLSFLYFQEATLWKIQGITL